MCRTQSYFIFYFSVWSLLWRGFDPWPGNFCMLRVQPKKKKKKKKKQSNLQYLPQRLYQFPKAAVTKYHKLGGIKQQKFILPVLEAKSLKSRYWQGCALSEGSKGRSFLSSSQFLGVADSSWHSSVFSCITPIFASVITWHSPSVSVSKFPSYKNISYWIKDQPNPV